MLKVEPLVAWPMPARPAGGGGTSTSSHGETGPSTTVIPSEDADRPTLLMTTSVWPRRTELRVIVKLVVPPSRMLPLIDSRPPPGSACRCAI